MGGGGGWWCGNPPALLNVAENVVAVHEWQNSGGGEMAGSRQWQVAGVAGGRRNHQDLP